ncbi:uncharacterized protein LOC144660177 [Oculina patagonica]
MEINVLRELLLLLACILCYIQFARGAQNGEDENEDGAKSSGRKILVFGGNGFIGSETVRRLLDRGDEITIVNRGNWYFDSEERIKPFVKAHLRCDRDKLLKLDCEELLTSGNYDAVIDFSSYNARQIKQVVDLLRDRVGVYIYISTDSIYEVCEKSHSGSSAEEDAVRPKSGKKRLELKREEKYGHDKLACEEVLEEERKSSGLPYVALRFPDVIGPRDSSFRFWTYQLWIRIHKEIKHPVHMPSGVSEVKFSLIHVEDAAKAIEKVLDVGPAAHNQAINVAFNEHFTLKELLRNIADKLGIDELEFLSEDDVTWYSYPTVTKGPLDISKAKILLDWEPMTWETALDLLTSFFDGAMTDEKFLKEREVLMSDIFESIVPEEHYPSAIKKLEEIYGKEVMEGIAMDVGYGEHPEIAGASDGQNSSAAHGQKSAEMGAGAHTSETGEESVEEIESENEASASKPASETKKKDKHSDEL